MASNKLPTPIPRHADPVPAPEPPKREVEASSVLDKYGSILRAGPIIVLDTIDWGSLPNQDASFDGDAGQGLSVYVQPDRPIDLHFHFENHMTTPIDVLVIAHVDERLVPMVRLQTSMPPSAAATPSKITLQGWQFPFPPELYGYHAVHIECWVRDPNGQHLPPTAQSHSGDHHTYKLLGADRAWLYITPGCRGIDDKGLSWSRLDAFTVEPREVELVGGNDPSYNKAWNTTVSWQISHAGFPSTKYGYKGSFRGVRIEYPGFPTIVTHDDSRAVGALILDIGDVPYHDGDGVKIYENTTSGCTFPAVRIPFTRPQKSSTPVQTDPWVPITSMVQVVSTWVEPQSVPKGQSFVAFFDIKNAGTAPSPAFEVKLSLDGSLANTQVTSVAALTPQGAVQVKWPISQASDPLTPGAHRVDCFFLYGQAIILVSTCAFTVAG